MKFNLKVFLMGILGVILLTLIMLPAYAQVDTNGLTPAQKAELTIKAEEMKKSVAAPAAPTVTTPQAVAQWAEAGKSLAVGLGAGAKEIGVAVNEFSETRVGKITTYIIIWKLMGKEILGLVIGFSLIFIAIPVVWHVSKRIITETVVYEDSSFWGIPMRRKKSVTLNVRTDGDIGILIGTTIISLGLLCVGVGTLPF